MCNTQTAFTDCLIQKAKQRRSRIGQGGDLYNLDQLRGVAKLEDTS